jgi:hypothetical protein
MCELILYLNFYVKSEKTFQHSFKRLKVKKFVHNVLTFYRFNNHDIYVETQWHFYVVKWSNKLLLPLTELTILNL